MRSSETFLYQAVLVVEALQFRLSFVERVTVITVPVSILLVILISEGQKISSNHTIFFEIIGSRVFQQWKQHWQGGPLIGASVLLIERPDAVVFPYTEFTLRVHRFVDRPQFFTRICFELQQCFTYHYNQCAVDLYVLRSFHILVHNRI